MAIYDIGDAPCAVTFDGSLVWVTDFRRRQLVGVDPVGNGIVARHPIAQSSCSVAFADGALFVAERSLRYLTRRDPASGEETAEPIISRNVIWDVDAGHGSIWFLDQPNGILVEVDPVTNQTRARTDEAVRVDPATNEVVARIATGDAPVGLAAADGYLWVSHQSGIVAQVDTGTNLLLQTLSFDGPHGEPAIAAGSVWVPSQNDGLLRRIDLASGELQGELHVADQLAAVWFVAGDLWATTYADSYLYRLDPDAA